ncbi:hypothetical protein BG003_001920 [Podila horticola]|nr:hypothetical protein BG003_001920 [Podila horticola]
MESRIDVYFVYFVEFLKRMPVLESLHWSRSENVEYDLRFKEIAKLAAMGQIWTCLHSLHSLVLESLPDTLSDADLALVLGSVAPSTVRKLSVVAPMQDQQLSPASKSEDSSIASKSST